MENNITKEKFEEIMEDLREEIRALALPTTNPVILLEEVEDLIDACIKSIRW